MLSRNVEWHFPTDVLAQPIRPIFKFCDRSVRDVSGREHVELSVVTVRLNGPEPEATKCRTRRIKKI